MKTETQTHSRQSTGCVHLKSHNKHRILPFYQFPIFHNTAKVTIYINSIIMSADLDLSPPEVPEPTFFESLLRYGLFLGAIFQLICILAVIIPTSKSHEQAEPSEPVDTRSAEQNRKSKGPVPQIRQKLKKESKKKR
ncbi:protein MANBAL [Pimephales promelas]|uniref:protein MANBAL n=1 Tax=Pimephales promelas TaxID=90988 RepID=UPI0019554BDA|nr:protein MANBAL [Pimephales promelas]KAG1963322.1 protein MANBAL [Pimephales promelas]